MHCTDVKMILQAIALSFLPVSNTRILLGQSQWTCLPPL